MYNYCAYGLGIRSDLPLPGVATPAEARSDVAIRFGHVDAPPPRDGGHPEGYFRFGPREAYLHWDEVGTFLVSDGNAITVSPASGAGEGLIRLPLMGAVFAVLLHQRGRLVLHASAVNLGGAAAVIIGEKGQGKSTTAAGLYARGHGLVSDDVVAIETGARGRPVVHPGFPQSKLMPEAAASALGIDPSTREPVAEGFVKLACDMTANYSARSLPLSGVYSLAGGDRLALKRLTSQEAFRHIVSNSYVARFGAQLLGGKAAAAHLKSCAGVVGGAPVYRLERPKSFVFLSDLMGLIESQARRDAEPLPGRAAVLRAAEGCVYA